jgi:hypothetical protein
VKRFAIAGQNKYVPRVRKTVETVPLAEAPFDPELFAASVPSRKPKAKDKADAKERIEDAIEPKEDAKIEDRSSSFG